MDRSREASSLGDLPQLRRPSKNQDRRGSLPVTTNSIENFTNRYDTQRSSWDDYRSRRRSSLNHESGTTDPKPWGIMKRSDDVTRPAHGGTNDVHDRRGSRETVVPQALAMSDRTGVTNTHNTGRSLDRRRSVNRLSQPMTGAAAGKTQPPYITRSGGGDKNKTVRSSQAAAKEEIFFNKMREIIYEPNTDVDRPSPAKILNYIYLGSYWDANNPEYLTRLGITHVLNCSASQRNPDECPYHPDTGILWYAGVSAVDKESYDMIQHVDKACAFMKKAKNSNGKVLIHSTMGVNRSVILLAIYLIGVMKIKLIQAVRLISEKRSSILQNEGFQKQLVRYAQKKGLL